MPATPEPATLRHHASLDSLRALAVLAVIAYHYNASWARGGFLGVDLFFVLSGYLITSLVLHEWAHTGQVNLGRFWSRRAESSRSATRISAASSSSVSGARSGNLPAGMRLTAPSLPLEPCTRGLRPGARGVPAEGLSFEFRAGLIRQVYPSGEPDDIP